MPEVFEWLLKVSMGWAQARLTLTEETAVIEYDASGSNEVRYVMHCKHHKLSDYFGVLKMVSLENYEVQSHRFTGNKTQVSIGQLIDPEEDDTMLEVLDNLLIEYIRLPESQLRLNEMGGNVGVHDWTNKFDLILMIHEAGYWFDESERFANSPLGQGIERLDKMHFQAGEGKFVLRA